MPRSARPPLLLPRLGHRRRRPFARVPPPSSSPNPLLQQPIRLHSRPSTSRGSPAHEPGIDARSPPRSSHGLDRRAGTPSPEVPDRDREEEGRRGFKSGTGALSHRNEVRSLCGWRTGRAGELWTEGSFVEGSFPVAWVFARSGVGVERSFAFARGARRVLGPTEESRGGGSDPGRGCTVLFPSFLPEDDHAEEGESEPVRGVLDACDADGGGEGL